MAINVTVDDKLIDEARKLGEHGNEKEAMATALEDYVRHRGQLKILDLFGKVDYYDDYDYKAARRGKLR